MTSFLAIVQYDVHEVNTSRSDANTVIMQIFIGGLLRNAMPRYMSDNGYMKSFAFDTFRPGDMPKIAGKNRVTFSFPSLNSIIVKQPI